MDVNANSYYVAKWNGMAWSKLGINNGATFNYYINSVATDAKGNVYAAGNFGDNYSKRYVNKWNGTTWSELGGAPFNYAINTIAVSASGKVYAGGNFTDSNSHYYVAEYAQNILPVTVVNFTAVKENKSAAINWETVKEINTSYFNIQRSIDGISFSNIGKVPAKNSNTLQNYYAYVDNIAQLNADRLFYRLQEVDIDGNLSYSDVKIIEIQKSSVLFTISPNPANDYINIVASGNVSKAQVVITDMNGRTLYSAKYNFNAGEKIQLPTAHFAKQILIVTINTNHIKEEFKVIKE